MNCGNRYKAKMKIIVCFLIALTTLISVEADIAADNKSFKANKTAQYANMTEIEIKSHINQNLVDLATILNKASAQFRHQDLGLVADFYDNIIKFVKSGVSIIFALLKKETDSKRMDNLVKLVVIEELIIYRIKLEQKRRAENPIKVDDTLADLEKKFHDVSHKVLNLTKWTVEEMTKTRSFWAEIHKKIYDYLITVVKGISASIQNLKTDTIKAKNLKKMIENLTLMLDIFQIGPPPQYFCHLLGDKSHNFNSSVVSTLI